MRKKYILLISIILISVSFVSLWTKEQQQKFSLDETIIDINKFKEYKGEPIIWKSSGRANTSLGYGETIAIREGWGINGNASSVNRAFQYTLLYQNKMKAALAFYLFSPNRIYQDEWSNYYDSNWNLTKESNEKLKANRYLYYCGIGTKDGCQIWNYWAQYDNYIVLFGLYDITEANSIEEIEIFISEIDANFYELLDN